MRYHELDRWHIGPDERSVDHGWVYAFRAGMICGAGVVVQADEYEDEVAVDRTSEPPRDHLVNCVLHKEIPAVPCSASSPPPPTEIAPPTPPAPAPFNAQQVISHACPQIFSNL